jgi:hypothetical protein
MVADRFMEIDRIPRGDRDHPVPRYATRANRRCIGLILVLHAAEQRAKPQPRRRRGISLAAPDDARAGKPTYSYCWSNGNGSFATMR